MELDDLFDEYKKVKAKAGKDPIINLKAEQLLNRIADVARDYCMNHIYRNQIGPFEIVPKSEAHSIFNEVFTERIHEDPKVNPRPFSKRLNYYFLKRLLDCRRDELKIPVPISPKGKYKNVKPDELLEYYIQVTNGHEWIHPDSSIRAKEILKGFFDGLKTLSEFQQKVILLVVNGNSNDEIARFLKCSKKKINKEKHRASKKLEKTLQEEKE